MDSTIGQQTSKEFRGLVRKVTLAGLLINFLLSLIKAVVGYFARSNSLVADGIHSLSDSITDVVVIVGVGFWSEPADDQHPYGHGKIESVVTLFIGLVLALVSFLLVYKSVISLYGQVPSSPGIAALFVAIFSVIVKEFLYRWNCRVGQTIRSQALIANAWHHRSDALSSIPVAVAVLGSYLKPEWVYLDHIATLLVGLFILYASYEICAPAMSQLIDQSGSKDDLLTVESIAREIDGVKDIHALRSRQVGDSLHMDLHVLVDPEISVFEGHLIAGKVKSKILNSGICIIDVLIHIEPFEGCKEDDGYE